MAGISRSILITLLIIIVVGLVMVYSASSALSLSRFKTPFFYFNRQLIYLFMGLLAFFAVYKLRLNLLKRFSMVFLIFTLVLVALTIWGPLGASFGGAARWLTLKFGGFDFTFIPGELLKIAVILYFAAILSSVERPRISKEFLPLFFWLMLMAFLLLKQPSTGVLAIIAVLLLILYFMAGARTGHIFLIILLGGIIFLVIVGASPYRMKRVFIFLNPSSDVQGSSYQINQAKIAIGSGGIFGKGLGHSDSKLVLPEPFVDSIFAIYAEETGFVGSTALLAAFFYLILRMLTAAQIIHDRFFKLFIFGFAALIGLQMMINTGALVGLLPLTGVPLPFISYGGSSLISLLFGFGIVFNMINKGERKT